MSDGRNPPLTHEQILALRLVSNDDGELLVQTPGGFIVIGQFDPAYVYLLRASQSLYTTLDTVGTLLDAFLHTAEAINEGKVADQLLRINAAIDLVKRYSRNEA